MSNPTKIMKMIFILFPRGNIAFLMKISLKNANLFSVNKLFIVACYILKMFHFLKVQIVSQKRENVYILHVLNTAGTKDVVYALDVRTIVFSLF